MRGKGCVIAAAAAVGLMGIVAAILAPALWRHGRRVAAPVMEMKAAERELRDFVERHPWSPPPSRALTDDQLDRFLALRRDVVLLEERSAEALAEAEKQKPGLADVPDVVAGVGSAVSSSMKAFVANGMTPDEYAYVERLVYRDWRAALRRGGQDPAVALHAAREVERAAADEADPAMRRRLAAVAAALQARVAPPPAGFPEDVHRLLLTRIADIDALASDGGGPAPRVDGP